MGKRATIFNPDSSYRHASHAFTFTDVFLACFFMVYEGQNIQKGPVLYDKIAEYKTRSSALYKVFLAAFVLQVCYLNCNVASSLLLCIY